MRFFVEIQIDVHNLPMATDRHQAPSYPLRMPDELKARVQEAAVHSGRSLHAELLHRLQRSFSEPEDFRNNEERLIEALLLQRLDSVRTQYTAERTRCEALMERLSRTRSGGGSKAEIDHIQAEINQSYAEQEDLINTGESIKAEIRALPKKFAT